MADEVMRAGGISFSGFLTKVGGEGIEDGGLDWIRPYGGVEKVTSLHGRKACTLEGLGVVERPRRRG